MSNSSDGVPQPADDTVRTLARILDGLAHECSSLGYEITRVGDTLSDADLDAQSRVIQLQSFDIMSQAAHAQSRLVAHLARLLLIGISGASADMLRVIEEMPLPEMKRRLHEKLGLQPVPQQASEEELWFDEPARVTAGGA